MPDTRQPGRSQPPMRNAEGGKRKALSVHGRRFRFAVFLAALGLIAASCSAGVAATVDGVDITNDDIVGLTTDFEDASSVNAEQYRDLLMNTIFTVSMVTAAEEDFGLKDLSSDAATDAYLAEASQQDIELIGRVASNPGLTADAVDLVTVQLSVRNSVKEALAMDPEFLQGIWQNDQNLLIETCARHVLVETEDEANVAKARFEAGEDFSAIATDISLDTQSPGGALPCPSRPDDFVQPFSSVVATAPVGELAGPVETQFGWHIVLVDSREFPQSLDELSQDPLKWIPPTIINATWIGWLNDVLETADIEVNSQIGTWYSPVDGIIPPPPSP
jgi:parvulin-like peptidyl-prolyl isomerase